MQRLKFLDRYGVTGICGVDVRELPVGKKLVVLTELTENPAMSVTNAAEQIATAVVTQLGVSPDDVYLWLEHYSPELSGSPDETYAELVLEWEGQQAVSCRYRYMSPDIVRFFVDAANR